MLSVLRETRTRKFPNDFKDSLNWEWLYRFKGVRVPINDVPVDKITLKSLQMPRQFDIEGQ